MFLFKTKIDLYCLKNFEKSKINLEKLRKYGRSFERFWRKLTKISDQN